MRATLLYLFLLCAASAANPYVETFTSEICPDSLDPWIEIHAAPQDYEPVSLTGWVLTTTTSACTLDYTLGPGEFLVVDSQSLAWGLIGFGTIRLSQACDTVHLVGPLVDEIVPYPCILSLGGTLPAPPPGGSIALWNYDDEEDQSIDLYLDSTPTRGGANDDYGTISGAIGDDSGHIVEYGGVWACGATGRGHIGLYHATDYCVSGLPVGRYQVLGYAMCNGRMRDFTLPESVSVGYSEDVTGIDIVLSSTGIAEAHPARRPAPAIRQQGRNLTVTGNGHADVSLFDLSGREATILYRGTLTGERRIALPRLAPGVYFARANEAGNRITTKVVIR